MIGATITWLNDPLNWRASLTSPGIPAQVLSHLTYSGVAVLLALAIGVPVGLLVGHSGRGTWVVAAANGLRALPTVGLLILFYVLLAPLFTGRGQGVYLVPTEIVLVLLAVPPILANTYAGVQNVDPAARDAARGMGMTGAQVLLRVELPNALPLLFSGLRAAALQVIATATVAAYVGLDGLGRFVYDGLARRDFAQTTGGAVIVAVTALVVDLVLAGVQRVVVSRGVSGRFRRGRRRPVEADARSADVEQLEPAAA